jgi:twitching motility protein PilT
MFNLNNVLDFSVKNNASDIHFSSGLSPYLRIQGTLRKVEMDFVSNDDLITNFKQICTENQWDYFQKNLEIDFSIAIQNIARFRVNIYHQSNGISAAFRVIPHKIRTLDELQMPPSLINLTKKRKGLILCTGPTGSGKSTTLAAMIDQINSERKVHIITIEDPIEYVHSSKKSLIHQRELGSHTKSFAAALRASLREDPDIILIGEMRDLETISLALHAAETGHLVLSTLHTNTAAETVDRIVDVFPSDQQKQIQIQLANTIEGVIAQRLVPKQNSSDRAAIIELMLGVSSVRNLIREGKSYQIMSVIQTGSQYGMQTYEKSLQSFVNKGMVAASALEEFIS